MAELRKIVNGRAFPTPPKIETPALAHVDEPIPDLQACERRQLGPVEGSVFDRDWAPFHDRFGVGQVFRRHLYIQKHGRAGFIFVAKRQYAQRD